MFGAEAWSTLALAYAKRPGRLWELEDPRASGIVMTGDTVHAQLILGSQDGNESITDGVELVDLIAKNEAKPVDTISLFYELRYQKWKTGSVLCVGNVSGKFQASVQSSLKSAGGD